MDTKNISTPVKKDNNIKREWGVAALFGLGFFVVLLLSNVIDQKFNISAIFNLVDFYIMIAKAFFASAIAWTIQKLVFKNTLGLDFGKVFNDGWNKFTSTEKTKWILITFLVIFVSVMFNFG
jgi:hypothetical protein